MWGQVTTNVSVHTNVGIIPTRVGTSKILIVYAVVTRDHPHACGDKFYMV